MTMAMPTAMIEHPSQRLIQNLATAVEGAIWAYDPIRQTNTILRVSADDGVVTLAGNMRSSIMTNMAGRLAAGVPGVRRVVNALVSDTDIESRAAVAVAMDPDAGVLTDRISLFSILGTVEMDGVIAAPTLAAAEALRQRVEAIVRAVPGVHGVINQIQAVEGAADVAAGGDEEAAPAGGPSEAQLAMQERMAVWRERAKAAGKL
ncbi:hypothetical protein DCC79_05000 [bacterium]|nr:BON domain-containing protein [Chloroflexi bacterium CFX6]RIL11401.1 MAG: hypothetical protein DCC79_05000 [bacterium]